jgi:hypothetical protein
MNRLLLLLCLIVALAAGAPAAHADTFRFPASGKHAFHITLPKGWQTKMDTRGGLLLFPPSHRQRAMVYVGILVDDNLRGRPDSEVAAEVGRIAGVETFDKQEAARVTDAKGTRIYRGTAFFGQIPGKRGLARKARIVIFPLEPNTWAQVWTVTQAGMNAPETAELDRVLNDITLASDG